MSIKATDTVAAPQLNCVNDATDDDFQKVDNDEPFIQSDHPLAGHFGTEQPRTMKRRIGAGAAALTYLNISGNEAASIGARELAKGLENNAILTTLDLRSCNIGSAGAKAILKAARNAKGLKFINMAMNGIGYDILPSTPISRLQMREDGCLSPPMTPPLLDLLPQTPPSKSKDYLSPSKLSAVETLKTSRSAKKNSRRRHHSPGSSQRTRSRSRSASPSKSRNGSRGRSRGSSQQTTSPKPLDEIIVHLDIHQHIGLEFNKDLTVLVVSPGGQADRLAGENGTTPNLLFPITMGCKLMGIGGSDVKSKLEMHHLIDEMIEEGLAAEPVPFRFRSKIARQSVFALEAEKCSTQNSLQEATAPRRITVATHAFFESLFERCPFLERLNASFNAGISSVLIFKKPSFDVGSTVNINWRGRGQWWEAKVVRVNKPVQSFDVRYTLDNVLDEKVPPFRVQGYVKDRMRDV